VAGGSVHVPWYATGFRADALEEALGQIAPIALRYGATDYAVHRSRDDRYRFVQMATFTGKDDWERYWFGDEFVTWRSRHSSWYQVPVLYQWHDVSAQGALDPELVRSADE
jgi:hypothetical protein